MLSEKEKKREEFIRRNCGERFVGAHLSKIVLNENALRRIFQWITEPKNFLVLMGPPGTGKTYFCAAIIDALYERYSRSLRYFKESALMSKLRSKMSDGTSGDFISELHYLLDDQITVIDDIFSTSHTDWREDVLLETIDYRYERRLPTIFTTNATMDDLKERFHPRIISRLFAEENVIINFSNMPDMRKQGF